MLRRESSSLQKTLAFTFVTATCAFATPSPVIATGPSDVSTTTAIVPAECPGVCRMRTPFSIS